VVHPGPVWTCAKNLAPNGIRSPDRPARSQSLYRLNYPAHFISLYKILIFEEGEEEKKKTLNVSLHVVVYETKDNVLKDPLKNG
jgi:hypothetical protein